MSRLLHWSLGLASAAVLATLAVLTFIDVCGRYLFNQPVRGAYELVEMLMGALIFSALPVITYNGRHITIDLFDAAIPQWLIPVRSLLVQGISAAALGIIAWQLWLLGDDKASYNDMTSFLRIPQAPVVYAMSVLAGCSSVVAALLASQALIYPRSQPHT
ncbi:MAG TPA: TRAP transporter small permease [Aestuariivirgaceae bacterium]|nr:TRAP transporter small permease [Aestuariivirgaceae bacterium]